MNEQHAPNGIEWTRCYGRRGFTSNPIRGCLHKCQWLMPTGLVKCYAKSIALKFTKAYPQGFEHLSWHPEELAAIRKLKEPAGIFIDSMSDLFGHTVDSGWIREVIDTISDCPQHIFMSLTKNPTRLPEFSPFPQNLWVGMSSPPTFMYDKELSLEQQRKWFRVGLERLCSVSAQVRWLSLEPLAIDLSDIISEFSDNLQWAVIGAGSDGAKTFQPEEAIFRRTAAALLGVPIFLKGNIDRGLAEIVLGEWREEFPVANKPAFALA